MTEQNNGQDVNQDGDESTLDNNGGTNGAGDSSDGDGSDDDSLLDALLNDGDNEDDDEDEDKKAADDKSQKPEDKTSTEDKKILKIGDRTFNSVEELTEWAAKQNGKVQDLIGQLKKAKGGDPADRESLKKEIKEEMARDSQVENWKGQVEAFWGEHPDAKEYREEMATFLRKGKANDANGKPSLAIAYAKSLKSDDKEVPAGLLSEVKGDETNNDAKKVMGAGEGRGSLSSAGYNTPDDIKKVSDEGDSMIFGSR